MIGWRFSISLHTSGLLVVCLVLAGCGKKEAAQGVRVRGTATYQGKPIPSGMILFEPDPAQKNSGSPGRAEIKDGKFDTLLSKQGIAIGPSIVHISGGDGVAPEPIAPFGKPLFEEYTNRIDISKDATDLNFDVPAAASTR